MRQEIIYQWALTRIPGIGPAKTRKLIASFGNAADIFHSTIAQLETAGLRAPIREAIQRFNQFAELDNEWQRLAKQGIRPLFFTDKDYPRRLNDFKDTPPLLFYKGEANLNASRIISVVGTRTPSVYGRDMTERIIRQLTQPGILILSGLAFGIDGCAHKAAMNNELPTVGVMGNGFNHFYPDEHKGLAKEMLQAKGGLLSQFEADIEPKDYRFAERNQVIAACCDALIVIESGIQGGSLLTVKQALRYEKQVFAVPGRITDNRSSGCNRLIRQKNVRLLSSGEELMSDMGWSWPAGRYGSQAFLPFTNNPAAKQKLLNLLSGSTPLTLDELSIHSRLNTGDLSILLLDLELQGYIHSLPGKRYQLRTDRQAS